MRHAGDGDGQAGAKRGGAADGRLHALLERGADDHVVDLGRVDPGALDRGADGVGGERRRRRGVERALIGRPIGVRAVETMTASRTDMIILLGEDEAEPLRGERGLGSDLRFRR